MNDNSALFRLVEEPRGKTYQAMLMFAQKKCPYFLLVERPGIPRIGSDGSAVLQALGRFLIEKSESREWPGTVLLGKRMATISTFKFTDESTRELLNATTGLYEWQLPSRPEDLCLLRPDKSPWLTTIAPSSPKSNLTQ